MPRQMSDAELRRRKKLQGEISRTTSTLGLGALGVTGAAALASKKPGALRAVQKVPGLKHTTPEKMKDVAINTGLVSGGIGGVGGYNFAAYTGAESKKRKQAVPVAKRIGMDMGYFGEEGTPLTHQEIEAEIEKAWTPSASNFDSERDRHRRSVAYDAGTLAAGTVGGAYAGHHGVQAVKHARTIKPQNVQAAKEYEQHYKTKSTNKKTGAVTTNTHTRKATKASGKVFRALDTKGVKPVLAHSGKAALGAGVLGGSIALGAHVRRKHATDWQPYSKRDSVSAFGVDHQPSGQHRETEN